MVKTSFNKNAAEKLKKDNFVCQGGKTNIRDFVKLVIRITEDEIGCLFEF
jgi:hypothetical protein